MAKSIFTIIGTGAGAVAGGIYGGPAGAMAGASAGASLGGGIDSYLGAQDDSEAIAQTTGYNSLLAILNGEYNADSQMAMANFNAGASLLGANMSAALTEHVAEFNARLQRQVAEYEATQYENEARLIWEEADLAIFQYEQQARQRQGQAVVQYGASGVQLDVVGDTPNTMLVNMKTQASLDVMIYRHGADISAHKMLDASARSRWEGEMVARKFMFEGIASSASTKLNASIGASAMRAQGAMNSDMIKWDAFQEAGNIVRNGNFAAGQTAKAGQQALISGVLGAASSISTAYGNDVFKGKSSMPSVKSLLASGPIKNTIVGETAAT